MTADAERTSLARTVRNGGWDWGISRNALDTASEECNKAPAIEGAEARPEYRHNVNWRTNPHRCPMYLSQIHEGSDGSWPAQSDDAMLAHFHRLRTLRELRAVYDRIGPDVYRRLVEHFPNACSSAGCG